MSTEREQARATILAFLETRMDRGEIRRLSRLIAIYAAACVREDRVHRWRIVFPSVWEEMARGLNLLRGRL